MANCIKIWFEICALCILYGNRRARVVRAPPKQKSRLGLVFPIYPIHHFAKRGRPTPTFNVMTRPIEFHSLFMGLNYLACEFAYIVSCIVVHFVYFLSSVVTILYHKPLDLSRGFLNFFYFILKIISVSVP